MRERVILLKKVGMISGGMKMVVTLKKETKMRNKRRIWRKKIKMRPCWSETMPSKLPLNLMQVQMRHPSEIIQLMIVIYRV